MKSGGKFKKTGRPSLLEQNIKESIPDHLRNISCSVTEALESSIGVGSVARAEWVADRKIDAVGMGLTTGRQAGGQATKKKTAELKKYLERCHQELLIPGNFSAIAKKILRREASEADGGWSDQDWLNGADGSIKRHVPSHSSLRRIVAEIISGKG
jgi:hypothetical protein